MKPIAVFTADNHLRPQTWNKHPTLFGDAYESFQQIIECCLGAGLPLFLLGDLFDKSRPDSWSVGIYLDSIRRMEQARLPVYYIEGNHDKADPPWASLTPWATPLGACQFAGINFYGISFSTGQDLIDSLANIPPETNVLLTHQSWQEIQQVGITDASFGQIPHGLVMLTGDYHVCGTYTGQAADHTQVTAYSPGSTVMQALNEPDAKYFGILYEDLTVTWCGIDTRHINRFTLHSVDQLDSMVERLSIVQQPKATSVIGKPILQVKYNDQIPEAFDRLMSAFSDNYHLFLEPQRQIVTEVIAEETADTAAFDTLESAACQLCINDPPTHAAVYRLSRAVDPAQEFSLIYDEFRKQYEHNQNQNQNQSHA